MRLKPILTTSLSSQYFPIGGFTTKLNYQPLAAQQERQQNYGVQDPRSFQPTATT